MPYTEGSPGWWREQIDGQAGQANERLVLMERSFTNGSDPDACIANALRAIATQLALANGLSLAVYHGGYPGGSA